MARLHHPIRSTLSLIAALLLIGSWEVLVAPGLAEASCGDYLMMMPGHGHSSASIATVADMISGETAPMQSQPSCRGPHCDRGRVPWAPVPGFLFERMHVEVALVNPVMGLALNRTSGSLCPPQVRELSGYPRLIERPPRQV